MLVFPSKRDTWITITIAAADLLMLFATATMLLRASGAVRIVFPLFFLGVVIFTGSMLVGTRYVIRTRRSDH